MHILATGSRGQLGRHLQLIAPQSAHQWFFADIDQLDITQPDAVQAYVRANDIDLIVNCAAYTNVDAAESDEANAHRINAEAVQHLADAMRQRDGWLIHISTDYVFGGTLNNTPCAEDQHPNPTGAYGRTKLAGEEAAASCRSITLRTAWLYSEFGKNFLLTMLRLTAEREQVSVVIDQVGTPTYAADLAYAIFQIIEQGQLEGNEGIYHFSNEGVCSWYDFAHEIAIRSGHTACRVLPCRSSEYPSPVRRPSYSVLDKTLFKQTFHQTIPHWTDGLRRCLENIAL